MIGAVFLFTAWLVIDFFQGNPVSPAAFIRSLLENKVFMIMTLALGAMLILSLALRFLGKFYNMARKKMPGYAESRKKAGETSSLKSDKFNVRVYDYFEPSEIDTMMKRLSQQANVDIPALVDFFLAQAVGQGASDIHLEPTEHEIVLRYRIDGVLHEISSLPKRLHARICSRLRVLSNLSIYEKGKPQDGRLQVKIKEKSFEVRISILPTLHGEKVVIRLFETGELKFNLDKLGFDQETLEKYKGLLTKPQGTVFLTGPTGSGKTTTIYSSMIWLYKRAEKSVNIVTIEDPIERDLSQFNQTQVDVNRGLSFAAGLRTILRQDPDIIMVGEIRDYETAKIAIQAGLTGHLVFTTVHSDSAAGVINRIINMQIEPFLLASSTTAVLAQRLIRKICPHCRYETIPPLKLLKKCNLPADMNLRYYASKGCEKCMNTGFKGRTGIFELMEIDDDLRDKIVKKVPSREIYKMAVSKGMNTLMSQGLKKVSSGETTLSELLRVIS